jgi:hypothetical protein
LTGAGVWAVAERVSLNDLLAPLIVFFTPEQSAPIELVDMHRSTGPTGATKTAKRKNTFSRIADRVEDANEQMNGPNAVGRGFYRLFGPRMQIFVDWPHSFPRLRQFKFIQTNKFAERGKRGDFSSS